MSDGAAVEVPGYENLVEIGRGGFAVVYRARQPRFDRQVALKVLTSPGLDTAGIKRFERECVAAGRLSWHPNIVVVHDAGQTSSGQPYLAMEYVEGGSLGDRMDQGALPWPEAVKHTVRLAGALHTAHEAGLLHRDIKPENALIDVWGAVKLTDFGIAAVTDQSVTATGLVTATIAHAAPEVLNGERATVRSDVYSLGSTLFELLDGTPAFVREDDETIVPILVRALNEPVPDLRPRGVPDRLATVVESAMAKDPSERPATAAELGERLREVERAEGFTLTDLPIHTGDGPPPEPRPPDPPDDRTDDPEPRGNRALLVGAAVACVGLLALIVAVVLSRSDSDDTNAEGARGSGQSEESDPPDDSTDSPGGQTRTEDPSRETLLAAVPEDYRDACNDVDEDDLPDGAVAAVDCFPEEGADSVRYTQFETQNAMYAHYSANDDVIARDSGPGCPEPSESGYEGAETGRLRCYVDADEFATVEWTNDDLVIHSIGARADGDLDELHRWWFSPSSGPVA